MRYICIRSQLKIIFLWQWTISIDSPSSPKARKQKTNIARKLTGNLVKVERSFGQLHPKIGIESRAEILRVALFPECSAVAVVFALVLSARAQRSKDVTLMEKAIVSEDFRIGNPSICSLSLPLGSYSLIVYLSLPFSLFPKHFAYLFCTLRLTMMLNDNSN